MKQLRVRMKYSEVQEIANWIDTMHTDESSSLSFCEMSALAILIEWQHRKLKPKLYWLSNKQFSFTLQAPVGFALLHFIMKYNEPETTFLGYCLHQLKTNIFPVFITKQIG
jgi:hypothetical protein